MPEMYRDDMLDRMQRLDIRANLEFKGDGRFLLVIVGGGMLVLRGYIARSTDDIDILDADSRLYDLMELFDMNGRVNAYMNSFPYHYENRIDLIWSGKKIDYYTASLEDIVISKICAGRERDIIDISEISDKINWEILDRLVKDEEELRLIKMSDRDYMNFEATYEEIERRFRPCEN